MKCLPFLLLISVILEPARPAGNLNAVPESLQQAQDRLLNQEVEQRRQAALRALKINPADASANYQLGMIALAQKKPAEALPYFERIHVQRATDIPPLTGILECQLLLKRRSPRVWTFSTNVQSPGLLAEPVTRVTEKLNS
jgi:tetratricopeptide (TPR) repeat protein